MQATLDAAEPTLHSAERESIGMAPDGWQLRTATPAAAAAIADPIVVVGSGPVGMRAVHELSRRASQRHIVWYGAESEDPYNRVQLSALLAGEVSMAALTDEYRAADYTKVERRFGCPVVQIDPRARRVIDARDRSQPYSQLILATGSRPRLPGYVDATLRNVFTFRSLKDAHALAERRHHSRCTVVLGGGMLGLEAAKALQGPYTQVILIDRGTHLLSRQLDAPASALLREHLQEQGLAIVLGADVRRVLGDGQVKGVQLADRVIPCDTLVVATGIVPNVELAQLAGLRVNRGIEIDDRTVTSDPYIHAIGECAEHRGTLYGLVAPGYEQARVAAATVAGTVAIYTGSITATRLKVVGVPVFSMGVDAQPASGTRVWTYRGRNQDASVRLVTSKGCVIGASAVGSDADISGLQQAVQERVRLRPWQLLNFWFTGRAWPKPAAQPVQHWPAEAVVCNCTGVTRGQLTDALNDGCTSVEALACRTGAGKTCGSCKPLLAQFLDVPQIQQPAKTTKPLIWSMAAAAILLAVLLLPWSLPYSSSASGPQLDVLWRDGFWRQTSGYTLFGLSVLAGLISARKRLPRFSFGDFGWWRVLHILIGVLGLVTLIAHTGGHLGFNLNLLLSMFFLAPVFIGLMAGSLAAREHKLGVDAVAMRRRWVRLHLATFWPLPLLLTFHVLQVYAF